MIAATITRAGNHETVEELIRYAANVFIAHGIAFPPSRMSKLIRRGYRSDGAEYTRRLIDSYVDRDFRLTWNGFERHALAGYADPTGSMAAHRVDRGLHQKWAETLVVARDAEPQFSSEPVGNECELHLTASCAYCGGAA